MVDPRRRRAGVGVGRLAGAASPSESMGGPPDLGVYDLPEDHAPTEAVWVTALAAG